MEIHEQTSHHETWRLLTESHVRIHEAIDHALQQEAFLSITDYQILEAIAKSSEHRVRMSDLAANTLVSRSRLTYRVDRLVDVGFIERRECSDDRRGLWALLTSPGLNAYQKAQLVYSRALAQHFSDLINSEEAEVIESACGRMIDKAKAT